MKPSKRRRQGYEAFFNGGDAQQECPCRNDVWERDNWIEGWDIAQAEHDEEERNQEEQDSNWIRNQIRDADNFEGLRKHYLKCMILNSKEVSWIGIRKRLMS